jgi:hypothetical protein
LDGVTSKAKHICTLTDVKFSYKGTDKDTGFKLNSVNVAARLSSRVAVIGPNGAGKSVSDAWRGGAGGSGGLGWGGRWGGSWKGQGKEGYAAWDGG